jgi:hypothetical protein
MQTPIEIPITIIRPAAETIQIAPSPQHDGLPVGRTLDPIRGLPDINDLISTLYNQLRLWEGQQGARSVTQRNLRMLLKKMGRRVFILRPGQNLTSILKLQGNKPSALRRILVYTDSESSKVPIETLWSDEVFGGELLGFVAANHIIPVSVVRHLGLEPAASLGVASGKPLRMLVVFSNPKEGDGRLGRITEEDGTLVFGDFLREEKEALDTQLWALLQLKLLEIHFIVGDECGKNDPVVYQGQVQLRKNRPFWIATETHSRDLRDIFLRFLGSPNWHILHYFGHGAGTRDPALVLRPGANLSCSEIGQVISQTPRLVVLNACESANPASPNAPALTGFATLFLLRGTVNLVCMQMKVTPKTATVITRTLYNKLSRSLFTRQLDCEEALYRVRQQVHDETDPRLDFFCPVHYFRPVNGPIFAYQDDRLRIWGSIRRGEELPWDPGKLCRVISWCLKMKKHT